MSGNRNGSETAPGKRRSSLRGRQGRMQGGRGSGSAKAQGAVRLWGRHAVEAALANPERRLKRIWAVREALDRVEVPPGIVVEYADAAALARLVPRDAPHQGLVLEADPLPQVWLADVIEGDPARPVILLDQVTDPHNIGAILRSAAAFDAAALVTQDRHAPPESGTIAKSASGALEIVPWVRVVNLSRALEELAEAGYWRLALDGEADELLADSLPGGPMALVLGAEGEGIRPNVLAHCDAVARLPISPAMESLNVSNAAAIALYAAASRGGG